MAAATLLYAVLAIAAGGLVTIAIWSPRRLSVKLAALAASAAFLAIGYAGVAELLSRPKPVSLEWAQRASEKAELLGAKAVEGEAIFLFLQLPGVGEPRAYQIPWRPDLAEQLQNAQRKAEQQGGGVMVERPFEDRSGEASLETRERMFYAPPPPALPPKAVADAPSFYQRGN
jgi:hypothetical protein